MILRVQVTEQHAKPFGPFGCLLEGLVGWLLVAVEIDGPPRMLGLAFQPEGKQGRVEVIPRVETRQECNSPALGIRIVGRLRWDRVVGVRWAIHADVRLRHCSGAPASYRPLWRVVNS